MSKEMKEECRFEVDGKDYFIRNITSKIISDAQLVYKRAFKKALNDGCILRKSLMKRMEEDGIWSREKQSEYDDYIKKIATIEYKLNTGKDEDRKLTVSEGRELAIELSRTRIEMRNLISEKNEADNNTAEATADNEKFNYLVSACIYDYITKKPVFSSYEDYLNRADSDEAYKFASEFARFYYGLEKDYEKTLTEYKFLKRFNLIDDDGNFINKDGKRVNVNGELIDSEGYRVDENGNRIDINRNPLEENVPGVENAEFLE